MGGSGAEGSGGRVEVGAGTGVGRPEVGAAGMGGEEKKDSKRCKNIAATDVYGVKRRGGVCRGETGALCCNRWN